MPKRRPKGPPPGSANTRLAYSTGGEQPEPERPSAAPETRSPGVRLRLERRASGRVVTVITGLPGTASEVAALAHRLKSACGTGGTVKAGVLELQGDHREAVEAELLRRGRRSKRSGG